MTQIAATPDVPHGDATAPKVLAAMSGGVDSSVATALLRDQGFEVVGSMLRFWPDDRPAGAFDVCCSPEAAFDARRIADRLDVPFYLLDAREEFERIVVDPFVPAYERGETPNPCVWCNREIKFGGLAERARKLGCSFLATGHYVRRVDGPDGVELHRGRDDDKDQTYFLWALPTWVLPYLLFPLGDLTKAEVRALAVERRLPVAWKPSSNGLCFVVDDVRSHLAERVAPRPGPVVDADGTVVGEHRGVAFYTVGQKRGLGLWKSHRPRWVTDLDAEANVVTVGPRSACTWTTAVAERANWLVDRERLPSRVEAQVRYRQRPEPATLTLEGEDGFRLTFGAPQFAVTIGQSAVVYDGDRLLGGGVIRARDGQGAAVE
ncbi:MAG: tRNA 2-thiouridine(34) synthase MnmA [Trueperaceae bacterium]|nr:tRNA 2-thiouridine(34) synthase MnmA [Trueperaceae bacterium]